METPDQARILVATSEAGIKAAKFADQCKEHGLPWMERLWRDFSNQAEFVVKLTMRQFQGETLVNQADGTTVLETEPNTMTVRNPGDGSETAVNDTREENPLPWSSPESSPLFTGKPIEENIPPAVEKPKRKRGRK